VKITGARIEAFLRNPDPKSVAVLVFGPDRGLVRERGATIARAVVDDPADPFRVVELSGGSLKSDPARLGDEAAAVPFGGGRKLIRISEVGDDLTQVFSAFLELARNDGAFVLVQAAELSGRSKLRKLFEGAKNAGAIACYADDARNLRGVIAETLKGHGLTATRDAMAFLAENLGSDREVTRAELDKLALYKGDPGEISLDDAIACVGDSGATSLDAVVFATGEGDARGLESALRRVWGEGASPVSVLRVVTRHFQRLHFVAAQMAGGRTLDQSVSSLRPPVIFLRAGSFKNQARAWTPDRLARAMELLLGAEIDCKSTGIPSEAVCSRALLRIAQAGASRRR
jgi:DNA polymerase III subunit delta